MLPGSTLIVACPTCGFLMTQQTWLSYSHWGGESWSDGSWSDRGLKPICSGKGMGIIPMKSSIIRPKYGTTAKLRRAN